MRPKKPTSFPKMTLANISAEWLDICDKNGMDSALDMPASQSEMTQWADTPALRLSSKWEALIGQPSRDSQNEMQMPPSPQAMKLSKDTDTKGQCNERNEQQESLKDTSISDLCFPCPTLDDLTLGKFLTISSTTCSAAARQLTSLTVYRVILTISNISVAADILLTHLILSNKNRVLIP